MIMLSAAAEVVPGPAAVDSGPSTSVNLRSQTRLVQVRDLSVLDEAFRDALDCSSGGQVRTKLTQLRAHVAADLY